MRPALFGHVKERGPRGWLARWWLRYRVRTVSKRLEEQRKAPRPPEGERG